MEKPTPASARAVFDHAVEIQSPADRQAYLARACGGDASIRQQVEALLRAYDLAGSFLEAPAAGLGLAATRPLLHVLREAPGTVVGPYKLREQIGGGGMGVVFLAEQTHPVRRKVALKVVKAGMDTRQVVARFEAERQALAMMDHPNIAKVFDAGATDSGRPYFVMELVRGVPITEYCDRNRVGTRERLELFVLVCHAVQHAHQKGIIHRDLKPSNVMITTHDGVPVPKVIDFGIAKAIGLAPGVDAAAQAGPDADGGGDGAAGDASQRLTEQTLFTEYRQLIGTPQYMSPEQADASSGLDADTRTDVYALGVLLYELLTGTTPLDAAALRAAGLDEMRRVIRESDPPPPSSRATTAAGRDAAAARQVTDARALGRLLRGELDWVVMRCLEKDRNRRYETSSALARDVTRYLNDEPVHARAAGAAYRARKFIRRHRGPVAAAAAVALALVLGIVGTTSGMLKARAARGEAVAERNAARASQRQAEDSAERARREAERATSVSGFIGGLLAMSHPEGHAGAGDAAAATLVGMASQLIGERLAGQPEEELRARVVLADSCRRLEFHDQCAAQLERAHLLSRGLPAGGQSERTLGLACDLATAMHLAGQDARAEPLARSTLQTARDALGDRHPLTWTATNALALAVGGPKSAGGGEEGRRLWEELVERLRGVPAARRAEHEGRYCLNLGLWFQQRERHDDALAALRRAAAVARSSPDSAPNEHARLADELSNALALSGAFEDARDLALAALRQDGARLGESHDATRDLVFWSARMLNETGRPAEALPLYQRYLDATLKVYPRGIPATTDAMGACGLLLLRRGDRAAAGEMFSRVATMRPALERRVDWLDHERGRAWAMCVEAAPHGPWRSPSLRNHVWCALDDLLRDRPPDTPDPARVPLARLRFKLQQWPGGPGEEAAADGAGATVVATGGWDELKALAEPEPGLYLLGLEVPRAAAPADPLRRASWLLVARWDVGVYPMGLFDTREDRWRALLSRGPATRSTRQALALPGELDPLTEVERTCWYGVVATATVNLPPGRYRFSLTSDDGGRLSVDGRPAIDAWSDHHSRTDDAELELAGGAHELRVENYQASGPHRLWLQVAPRTPAARGASAALGGGVPGLEWQAESAARLLLPNPADSRAAARRADALARAGRFDDAAEACAVAARLEPSEARWYSLRALLLAPSADEAAYRETCEAMLRQFGTSADAGVREQLLMAHAARPGPGGAGAGAEHERRLEQLLESALPAAGDSDDHPSIALAQGIAQYRLGRFDAAARTLRRHLARVPEESPAARASGESFLAMCCHRLGQPGEARAALGRAIAVTESRLPTRSVDDLDDAAGGLYLWLLADAARREARAALDPPPSSPR